MPVLTDEQTEDRSWLCRSVVNHHYISTPEGQRWMPSYCGGQATHMVEDLCDYIADIARVSTQEEARLRLLGVVSSPSGIPVCSTHHMESCENCGDESIITHQNRDLVRGYGQLCESCAEDYSTCADCGDWQHQDDLEYLEHEDSSYCCGCVSSHYPDEDSDEDCRHPNIHSHGYEPFLIFRMDPEKDKMLAKWPCPIRRTEEKMVFENNIIYDFPTFVKETTTRAGVDDDDKIEMRNRWYSKMVENGSHTSCGIFVERSFNIFCGMELEVEAPHQPAFDTTVNYLTKHYGDEAFNPVLYLKYDGSLGNLGYEICFHPFTLNAFKKFVPESLFSYLRSNGVRSWNASAECGLHIHINRASFDGESHQFKFTQFINNNSSNNFVVAGRNSHWAKYPSSDSPNSRHVMKMIKREHGSMDRYMAVNLNNADTIEVRIFKGSLRYERVLATMEYMNAIAEYTRSISVRQIWEGGAWDWRPFKEFVANNIATYSNLAGYLRITNQLQREREMIN